MKSKRFWAFVGALAGNFWLFRAGIHTGTDLISLGTGLALVNSPLFIYIAGETWRPSGTAPTDMQKLRDHNTATGGNQSSADRWPGKED